MAKKRKHDLRTSIVLSLVFMIVGIFLDHYMIPYFQPHSHLRVLYNDSMLTVDNTGEVPVVWAQVTVSLNHTESSIKNFTTVGSLDVRKPEPYGGGNYFWLVINNIGPNDWGAINITIAGPKGILVEVKSSCQYEIGGSQTVGPAPTQGAWGSEESYQQWLQKHRG